MLHHRLVAPALLLWSSLLVPAPGAEFQVLPEKSYRLDLPARKPDEDKFTKATRSVSADVFRDEKSARLVYVGKEGQALAVVPSGKGEGGRAEKAPKWLRRLVLPVRKFDDKEFGKTTPKVSVEVYYDGRGGNWVYVSHTGALAVTPAGKAPAGKPAKEPKWLYRLPLKVRYFDKFELEYHRRNVEVYRDEHAGVLLYVADSGALAVIPASKEAGRKPRPPAWSHAQELQVRKPGADEFGPKTSTRFGVEVYQDKNREAWVYVTEESQLAVLPGSKAVGDKAQPPEWVQGLRPPGAAAKGWSAEVFRNLNADHLIYVTASGAVAVVPVK